MYDIQRPVSQTVPKYPGNDLELAAVCFISSTTSCRQWGVPARRRPEVPLDGASAATVAAFCPVANLSAVDDNFFGGTRCRPHTRAHPCTPAHTPRTRGRKCREYVLMAATLPVNAAACVYSQAAISTSTRSHAC
jgi:hypothetical protein